MTFLSRRQRQTEVVRQPRPSTSADGQLFRRSRTLTGSVASSVKAATEPRGQLRSPRLKEHDLRTYRRRLAGAVVGLLCAALGLVWLLDQLIMSPQVSFQPAVAGSVSTERYARLVESYFATRPLERFAFWLNHNALSDYMVRSAPELVSAVITHRAGFGAYQAVLAPRTPLARWQIDSKVFFVDASGSSFERSLLGSPELTVKDESGLPAVSQQVVASTKMLRFIGQVVSEINRHSPAPIKEIIIPPATLKEVDVVVAGHPYRLKLSSDRDPVGQAIDAVTALKHLDAKGVTPRYLDVRVEGKAFYQ